MKMEFPWKLSDKVHPHTYTLISMINCPDNPASPEIEEKLCRNVSKECLRRKGILLKRYIQKYYSVKEKIYRQTTKYKY